MEEAVPAVASAPAPREVAFEFRATGSEYFRIWIVNLLLTIVTLGIYSAWAKVRRLRYFYGSTALDGTSFDYHADPKAILKGRLIAVLAYVVFTFAGRISPLLTLALLPALMFAVPWLVLRSRRFHLRMTSWRGLRFHFHGEYRQALAAYVGWVLLGSLTLGILIPLSMWKRANFLLSNAAYGSQRFGFTTTVGRFYRFYLLGFLLAIGALLVAVAVAAGGFAALGTTPKAGTPGPALVGIAAVLVPLVVAGAYFKASLANAAYGGLAIGPHRVRSTLRTLPLTGIILTNLLGIVFTLGFYAPWAKVRLLRYQLSQTVLLVDGDLEAFTAGVADDSTAVGEEISEIFDIDFGL
jgi:uncharacterized membrane protein YjgN (DUF898 family)